MDGTIQGTTQYYTLDMAAATATKVIDIKEGDTNSRFAQFSLVAYREPWIIPFGSTIHINVKKTDGTVATATCTRVDDHTVLAPITEQMGTVPGTQLGELYFVFPAGDIKSQSFKVVVHPAAVEEARIESSDDFQSLQDSLRDVKESTETADIAAQYATEQGDQARDAAQRAEDAAASIQVAEDAAANAKACESNAKNSELAAAQTQQEVTDYVEAQKAAFVGYSKRESDSKYANALTATATGEGGVTVEDAWTAPVLGLNVAGKSEQVATTGAQLFDTSRIATASGGGATVTNNGDGSFTVSGSGSLTSVYQKSYILSHDESIRLFPAGVYTMTRSPAYPYCYVQALINGASAAQMFSTAQSNLTITEETVADPSYVTQVGFYGAPGRAIVPGIIKLMINAGDTLKAYEPYTGGAPSPSPDYPQDIISTGTVSTGAQMLDFEQCLKEWNSKYTQSSERVYTVNALGAGFQNPISFSDEDIKVTLSGKVRDISGSAYRIDLLDSSGNLVGRIIKDTKSITGMASKIRLNFAEGGVGEYADIMLNAGDTALPWEPYTEGKPSPSVEYPQAVEVTATGANLFDASDIQSTTKNGVTFFNNGDGSITVKGTTTDLAMTSPVNVNLQPGTYFVSGTSGDIHVIARVDSGNTFRFYDAQSFAINESTTAVILYAQVEAGKTVSDTVRPMLNVGDMALSWEQYKGRQTVPITLTEPLRGIGEYRDRVMCRDWEWGIERWITKLTLAGNEDWVIYDNSSYISFYTRNPCLPVSMNKREGLCEQLRVMTIGGKNLNTIWLGANNKVVYAIDNQFYNDTLEDKGLANWKAHLAESPLEIITYLDAPTWEPLPAATQQALNALTTYAGTTHLTITAGGTPAEVTLDYVQDTQKAIEQHDTANRQYTDSQIAAIVAALPTATQAAIVDNQTTKLLQEV